MPSSHWAMAFNNSPTEAVSCSNYYNFFCLHHGLRSFYIWNIPKSTYSVIAKDGMYVFVDLAWPRFSGSAWDVRYRAQVGLLGYFGNRSCGYLFSFQVRCLDVLYLLRYWDMGRTARVDEWWGMKDGLLGGQKHGACMYVWLSKQ
jgi:hypothetical protein